MELSFGVPLSTRIRDGSRSGLLLDLYNHPLISRFWCPAKNDKFLCDTLWHSRSYSAQERGSREWYRLFPSGECLAVQTPAACCLVRMHIWGCDFSFSQEVNYQILLWKSPVF